MVGKGICGISRAEIPRQIPHEIPHENQDGFLAVRSSCGICGISGGGLSFQHMTHLFSNVGSPRKTIRASRAKSRLEIPQIPQILQGFESTEETRAGSRAGSSAGSRSGRSRTAWRWRPRRRRGARLVHREPLLTGGASASGAPPPDGTGSRPTSAAHRPGSGRLAASATACATSGSQALQQRAPGEARHNGALTREPRE